MRKAIQKACEHGAKESRIVLEFRVSEDMFHGYFKRIIEKYLLLNVYKIEELLDSYSTSIHPPGFENKNE